MQRWLNICKSINLIQHINIVQYKNHIITSVDSEKAFGNIQYLFMTVWKKLGISGTYLKILKAVYNKPIGNIALNKKELKSFLMMF
jgi:hypothetical protein